jgi:hypothetical protein
MSRALWPNRAQVSRLQLAPLCDGVRRAGKQQQQHFCSRTGKTEQGIVSKVRTGESQLVPASTVHKQGSQAVAAAVL